MDEISRRNPARLGSLIYRGENPIATDALSKRGLSELFGHIGAGAGNGMGSTVLAEHLNTPLENKGTNDAFYNLNPNHIEPDVLAPVHTFRSD